MHGATPWSALAQAYRWALKPSKPLVVVGRAHALPQMNGSGMVRNLRAAMSLSGTQADELEAAVAVFSATTTRDAQRAGRAFRHRAHTPRGRQCGAHVSSRA